VDSWVAIVRRNIALIVHAPLQIVEAWHGDVEMRLSACWIGTARALIIYLDDHLAASRSSQESTLSTTEKVVAGGGGPVH
jgi:hypothetical protein